MNPVTLFVAGPANEAGETDQLMLDLLNSLALTPYVVDISAELDMHLGLPFEAEPALFPHLYIAGLRFGEPAKILEGARNGELARALSNADISYDKAVASAITATKT